MLDGGEAPLAANLITTLKTLRGGCKDFHRDAVVIFDWDDTLMCSAAIKDTAHP